MLIPLHYFIVLYILLYFVVYLWFHLYDTDTGDVYFLLLVHIKSILFEIRHSYSMRRFA